MVALSKQSVSHRDGFSAYLCSTSCHHPISPEEEAILARRYRETGDREAAQQLMLANLRYVVKIALEYRRYGCDMNELVQAGNLGLAEAVHRFDPQRRVRLITYASWWIRDAVRQCIVRSRSVSARGTTRAERKLVGPSSNPDGPQWDVNIEDVRPDDLPVDRGPVEVLESVEDGERLKEAVCRALCSLDDRERLIAERRFMADDPATLAELSRGFGVSRERARQLAERAKSKLRARLGCMAEPAVAEVSAHLSFRR